MISLGVGPLVYLCISVENGYVPESFTDIVVIYGEFYPVIFFDAGRTQADRGGMSRKETSARKADRFEDGLTTVSKQSHRHIIIWSIGLRMRMNRGYCEVISGIV